MVLDPALTFAAISNNKLLGTEHCSNTQTARSCWQPAPIVSQVEAAMRLARDLREAY